MQVFKLIMLKGKFAKEREKCKLWSTRNIHSNICVPFPTVTFNGHRCFITLLDDFRYLDTSV